MHRAVDLIRHGRPIERVAYPAAGPPILLICATHRFAQYTVVLVQSNRPRKLRPRFG